MFYYNIIIECFLNSINTNNSIIINLLLIKYYIPKLISEQILCNSAPMLKDIESCKDIENLNKYNNRNNYFFKRKNHNFYEK